MRKILRDFEHYLKIKRLAKVSIKNYVSDANKFLIWQKTQGVPPSEESPPGGTTSEEGLPLNQITSASFEKYKLYLTKTKVPAKTINRHLSSLRSFGGFLKREKLLMLNPIEQLENISKKQIIKENPLLDTQQKLGELDQKHSKILIISIIILVLVALGLIFGAISYYRSVKAETYL